MAEFNNSSVVNSTFFDINETRPTIQSIVPGLSNVIQCTMKDGSILKCTAGYCCPNNSGCCINYMELWWFWLIWGLIISFSCFCAYHHHRIQHAQNPSQQRTQGTYVASCSYPGPPTDGDNTQMGYCKLPIYGDPRQNTERSPPPPYRVLGIGSFASILTDSWNSFWHQSNRNGLDKDNSTDQDNNKPNSDSQVEDIIETRQNLTESTP